MKYSDVFPLGYEHIYEFEPHRFSAEASELGLRPGEWPATLATTMGKKLPLVRATKKVDPDGDLTWVTYNQSCGCISLRIYND